MRPLLTTAPIRHPAEIGRVRDQVAALLDDVGEAQRHLVLLIVSELVTNALLHTGEVQGVRVLDEGDALRIEVDDEAGEAAPERRSPAPEDVTGRGLQIVGRVCRRWGVERHGAAKTVWCEFARSRQPTG